MSQGALWRAIAYSVVLIYLALDIFVIKGPLYQTGRKLNEPTEFDKTVVARVFNIPVTEKMLERGLEEYEAGRGKTPDQLTEFTAIYDLSYAV